ncbi:MAG: COG1361 S-layer family protein, partial [Methanosarcina sp.]|nr:COG1361 S-layer family protein [Methanosarcina sp.]
MGVKQYISFIFMILFSLLLCSGTSLAESTINTSSLDKGLSVDLLNQDPDPVNPGDVLEVRISIENTGYDDIENCFVEIKPEYPFKALSGEKLVESIGTLGKRSEDDRRKVLKFKVGVENDINEGSYPLKVYLYSTDKKKKVSLTKELTIDIDSESNAEIEYISVEKLIPGEKTKLTFGIRNAGNSPLKNSMFSWESTNDVILPVGSSNVKHINLIDV